MRRRGETRAAGIAGDLFVVTINRGAWQVSEVLRISGPFDAPLRGRSRAWTRARARPRSANALA
ncbi:MAG: hypothetical protein AUH09_02575 [Candidatus Rokubacteria bacterium 13_2_20CM_70_12]|nr:MAG: hypothetical protein AUH09_02575 [Candidatus Rokubacteria bacterium 13_2_20CM_70_12]